MRSSIEEFCSKNRSSISPNISLNDNDLTTDEKEDKKFYSKTSLEIIKEFTHIFFDIYKYINSLVDNFLVKYIKSDEIELYTENMKNYFIEIKDRIEECSDFIEPSLVELIRISHYDKDIFKFVQKDEQSLILDNNEYIKELEEIKHIASENACLLLAIKFEKLIYENKQQSEDLINKSLNILNKDFESSLNLEFMMKNCDEMISNLSKIK